MSNSSASPIVTATDPLKTYTRLIALGANVQQSSPLTANTGASVSTGLVRCQKFITRLTLQTRTDPQSIPGIASGLAVHCGHSDQAQDTKFLNNRAPILGPRGATYAEIAGPDAVDGIKDLTVGMATVVNATATGAARERFAIVSLAYAGKELMLDSSLIARNSTTGRGNSTLTVKSNGVWKQSESSAAGCVLTAVEAVYPQFISGVRLLFACPASSQGRSGASNTFAIAAYTYPRKYGTWSGSSSKIGVLIGVGFVLLGILAALLVHFRGRCCTSDRTKVIISQA